MIRRPPRSPLFPTRRSSDLAKPISWTSTGATGIPTVNLEYSKNGLFTDTVGIATGHARGDPHRVGEEPVLRVFEIDRQNSRGPRRGPGDGLGQIGRASGRKEWRSRGAPYHLK